MNRFIQVLLCSAIVTGGMLAMNNKTIEAAETQVTIVLDGVQL